MPGTVKSELLPDADRLHKCDGQEKVCEIQHLPLDKSHFITVYKQLSMQFDENGQFIPWEEDKQAVHVLSYDEKPGIQATATTSPDLLPDEHHSTISRVMNTNALGHYPCWQGSICRPEKQSR